MQKIYLFLFLSFAASAANCQQSIKLEAAKEHIGDSVKVCGKVVGGYYASKVQNTPTFLNMGAKYPNQVLTIVIWSDVRKMFAFKPEEVYKDRQICIAGRITEYQGKTQIVIISPVQLAIEN